MGKGEKGMATTARVSDDYWEVYLGEREIGTVVGGGPTRDTAFKAISPLNVAMNPDEAPAFAYARTLEEAAEALVRRLR